MVRAASGVSFRAWTSMAPSHRSLKNEISGSTLLFPQMDVYITEQKNSQEITAFGLWLSRRSIQLFFFIIILRMF